MPVSFSRKRLLRPLPGFPKKICQEQRLIIIETAIVSESRETWSGSKNVGERKPKEAVML